METTFEEIIKLSRQIQDKQLPTPLFNAVRSIQNDSSNSKLVRLKNAYEDIQEYNYNSQDEQDYLNQNKTVLEFYNKIYDLHNRWDM